MPRDALTSVVIAAAIEVHKTLGAGLLESAYEECLAREFALRSIPFQRQKPVRVIYKEVKLECGYRLDFVVANRVVVELKAVCSSILTFRCSRTGSGGMFCDLSTTNLTTENTEGKARGHGEHPSL